MTAVCASLLLLLGTCACTGGEDEQVLRIALPVDVTATDVNGDGGVYTQLVRRWEEQNPGWDVDILWLSPRADEQRSQLAVAMQTDPASYDVVLIDNQWVPEFSERSWIRAVDTEHDDLAWNGFLSRAQQAVCHLDRPWAVPLHMDVGLLYYRADLVDPDDIAEAIEADDANSWQELLELAGEVRDEHGLPYGYTGQFGNYEGLTVNALEFLLHDAAGPDGGQELFIGEDDGACATAVATSTEFGGLRPLEDEFTHGRAGESVIPASALEETETESLNRFRDGDVVFMRHWPRAVPQLQADAGGTETLQEGLEWVGWGGKAEGAEPAFGVLPLPTAVLGGNGLAVTEGTRHPEEAWSLVRTMTDEDAQEDLHASGLLPARRSGYQLETGSSTDAHYWENLRKVIDQGYLRPRTPYYPYVSEVLRRHVHLRLHPTTPDPSFEDMSCELNAALEGIAVTDGSCESDS
ncbi:extracellular solute-binding protein [Nocardiopsis algeriensis]|uniref:Multiple sugar transport system substrate-binding protein n=1 Tax=Nocardiopsis algeriensis TaxID=1478215 RepID=A0A841IST6_9ACTN|nr:extracellular solute-binding protein [Nocardiopsis algeriensis]MBB6121747.1 multiple sugar transport system substrate-binding protein [Nocardiopsis algeriensis]